MALGSTAHRQQEAYPDLVRVLLIVDSVVALTPVMTAVFRVHQADPSYEIVPDPVAAIGLPFSGGSTAWSSRGFRREAGPAGGVGAFRQARAGTRCRWAAARERA